MKQYCFLKIKSRISSKLILPNYSSHRATKKGVFFLALFSNIKTSCNNTIISDKKNLYSRCIRLEFVG